MPVGAVRLFERPKSGERAVLVHIDLPGADHDSLDEFYDLAVSAGAEPVASVTGARKLPEPKYFVGSGKAEEIKECVARESAQVVLVDHGLSPAQERNLERLLNCRVLDRTGLILDIFAQRARSHEGKLQVELAQLRHLSTRLVRGWSHLERQKGGIGLRGPGETQLESDRRLIGGRIKQLNKRLEKVSRQRGQSRRARRRAQLTTVSLVGYTNAGKSTLFNQLTATSVYAADQLFATLDPTLRRVALPSGEPIVLADTVGFIRQLPHDLVAAFRSTLQETQEAHLLLHVIDASHEHRDELIEHVNGVLNEIEADDVPQLEVYNKIDLIADAEPHIDYDQAGRPIRVWLSARTGAGLDLLLQAVEEHLRQDWLTVSLRLPPEEGRLRALLFERNLVEHEETDAEGGALLILCLTRAGLEKLRNEYPHIDHWLSSESEHTTRLAVAG